MSYAGSGSGAGDPRWSLDSNSGAPVGSWGPAGGSQPAGGWSSTPPAGDRRSDGNWFNHHYQNGLRLAAEAVEADRRYDAAAARVLYAECADSMSMALQYCFDPVVANDIQQKIPAYARRAEELAKYVESKAEQDAAPDKKSTFLQKGHFCAEEAIKSDSAGKTKEALAHYTEAVEYYMQALALAPTSERPDIEGWTKQVLERAEQLKHPAPTVDIAGMFPSAPTNTVAPRARSTPTARPAGKPAAAPAPATPAARPAARSSPSPARSAALSAAEKGVLKRSSFVDGRMYVPFMDIDLQEKFSYPEPFCDPDGLLKLAPKQASKLGGWKRPSEFMKNPTMIGLVSPYSITQDVVCDCSFVSSLCITAAYERRFKKQLITRIIYPQNRLGFPVYNPSGKYMVKLNFNGVPRKVIVDDRLPVDKRNRPLCCFSNTGNELWVSIIEKAYMKLNGGYDFPGSNSGIDLFCLTGWIPEHFDFDGKGFDKQRTWERLVSGAKHGDCLLTVATGPLSEAEEERFGLVQTHAYAVLDVRQVVEAGRPVRLLQVKNPWAHKRWKGAYSANDRGRWTPFLQARLNYDPSSAAQYDNGIFWIDYDSLLTHFRSVYFNWNPGLFARKAVAHASWSIKAPGPMTDTYNLGYNPQYSLSVNVPSVINGRANATAAVWLVLSRHVTRNEVTSSKRDREGRIGAGESKADPDVDYLALHVYGNQGKRVYYPRNALIQGVYSGNPNGLVRFDAKPGNHTYTLVVSQYERKRTIDYTLFVYSMAPVKLGPVRNLYREVFIAGKWTSANCGGNPGHSGFYNNPQYFLELSRPSDVILRLEAPVAFASNVRLYKSSERVLGDATEVMTSGAYRKGFSCAEASNIPAGKYVVLVSTYTLGVSGAFKVIAGATGAAPRLSKIPPLGHGMHKQSVTGGWNFDAGTAAGCSNHGAYDRNPRYLLHLREGAKVTIQLTILGDPMPSGNLAVYRANSQGEPMTRLSLSETVCTTGGGKYNNGSLITPNQHLDSGHYLLLPSTFDPWEGRFTVDVFASCPGFTVTPLP